MVRKRVEDGSKDKNDPMTARGTCWTCTGNIVLIRCLKEQYMIVTDVVIVDGVLADRGLLFAVRHDPTSDSLTIRQSRQE